MKIYDISKGYFTAPVYPGDPVPRLERLQQMQLGDKFNLTAYFLLFLMVMRIFCLNPIYMNHLAFLLSTRGSRGDHTAGIHSRHLTWREAYDCNFNSFYTDKVYIHTSHHFIV